MPQPNQRSFVVLDTAATAVVGNDTEIHAQVAHKNGEPVADFRLFMRAKRNGKFYRSPYGFSIAPTQLDDLERLVRAAREAFAEGAAA